MSDDERLLRAASRGDAQALEHLVRRYGDRVYRYLHGMLGEAAEAEDATQETFVRLARAVGRYPDGADPEPWILGIARRIALDHQAALATRTASSSPTDLAQLSGDLREALVLRDVLEWEPSRIATVLGVERDEVRKRLLEARELLVAERAGV